MWLVDDFVTIKEEIFSQTVDLDTLRFPKACEMR
jgi:hypothetical protein